MNRVGFYCRTSTEEQRLGKTIESQISELEGFARENKYEIVGRYYDDGWTGSMLERPQLDKLRDDVKDGKVEIVVALHPDRLSRVQLHQLLLMDEFEKSGAKVVFVNLPEYSEQSEESRVVNKSVWSMVSELERLRIRERTRRGKRNKAEKGLLVGHKAPYGYKYVKPPEGSKEGHYEIVRHEADTVKLIFSLAKQGIGLRGVIKKLAELKVPRRNKPKDVNKPIWAWTTSTIHKILTNQTYTGVTYFNKYESVEPRKPFSIVKYRRISKSSRKLREREKWIPIQLDDGLKIVTKRDFDFVQEQLKRNKTYSKRNTKHDYLLRGLVFCNSCGSLYYCDKTHDRAVYRCGGNKKHFPLPRICTNGEISPSIIEPLIWETYKRMLINPKRVLKEARYYDSRNLESRAEDSKVELDKINNQEERLLEGYREGIIDIGQLKEQMGKIRLSKSILENKKNSSVTPSRKMMEIGITRLCKRLSKVIDGLNFEEKQKIVRLLLKKVIYSKNEIVIEGVLPVLSKSEAKMSFASTTPL